jgi:hypothetical protein
VQRSISPAGDRKFKAPDLAEAALFAPLLLSEHTDLLASPGRTRAFRALPSAEQSRVIAKGLCRYRGSTQVRKLPASVKKIVLRAVPLQGAASRTRSPRQSQQRPFRPKGLPMPAVLKMVAEMPRISGLGARDPGIEFSRLDAGSGAVGADWSNWADTDSTANGGCRRMGLPWQN